MFIDILVGVAILLFNTNTNDIILISDIEWMNEWMNWIELNDILLYIYNLVDVPMTI